jgi:chorismate mutase
LAKKEFNRMWMIRGVRGATTIQENTAEAIVTATGELLQAMIHVNDIDEEHVASVIFTTTPDLDAAYPAQAARVAGWSHTALLGCQEMLVPGGLERCIRILIHWNTPKRLHEITHVYMNGAERLRPDLYPENKIALDHQNKEH